MKVFVNIAKSPYIGGGGFLMMANLANELGKIGYETYMFSQEDKLTWKDFAWLSIKEYNFNLATFDYILKQSDDEYRIIAADLRQLIKVPKQILNKNIRLWDHMSLFRVGSGYERMRKYTKHYLDKIAICNRYLKPLYSKIGYEGKIIVLENWINDLFKFENIKKNQFSIGFQRDGVYHNIAYNKIVARLKQLIWALCNQRELSTILDISFILKLYFRNVISCHGSQFDVAEKMKVADFFIYYHPQRMNYKKPLFIIPFNGEAFGLPLFEAMSCGCIVVAIEQEQLKFLNGTIPLVKNLKEGINQIKTIISNQSLAEEIRTKSIKLIEKEYRFDNKRKQAIQKLIE